MPRARHFLTYRQSLRYQIGVSLDIRLQSLNRRFSTTPSQILASPSQSV